ncbi:hypothetical protein IKF85_00835, partial [Candidatus Saccharibacteria bacterium]|nr:hypothetical protein [Candidatus Saccharibacteria bacterium]
KICYWPNAGDMTSGGVGVVDSMGDQSITSSTTSATLWASNFQRPGYGFAGWSDAYDYVVNQGSESNPDAHIYGPNEYITFTAGQYSATNGGLSLYAIWVESEGYLQNWNGCSSLGQGKVTALTDQRDGDVYAVAKLADGKCWMIENLRLDYDANFTESLSQGFGGQFIGLAQPEIANFQTTTANSLYYGGAQSGAASIDIGAGNVEGRMPRYRNDNTNTDSSINPNTVVANMTSMNQNVYSYGNYYSWPAAVASTASFSLADGTSVTTSLCPSGWRLPRGGNKTRIESYDDNDFWNLVVDSLNNGTQPSNYSSLSSPYYSGSEEASPVFILIRKFPNNFTLSGYLEGQGTVVNYRGNYGSYHTSTTAGLNNYSIRFAIDMVSPGTTWANTGYGRSIRCVIDY